MPINDSAGVGVYLIDKSQRNSNAIGFRAGVAIESARGLCNTPTLITSSKEFIDKFGDPNFDKFGLANLEAYKLAQNSVPMVVVRAKNPTFDSNTSQFGLIQVYKDNGKLTVNTNSSGASSISTPADDTTSLIYFKGEGDYCSHSNNNIVLRVSKPATESAYADKNRTFMLQVFDFDGDNHFDEDKKGRLQLNPSILDAFSGEGNTLSIPGYEVTSGIDELEIRVFINGKTPSSDPELVDIASTTLTDFCNKICDAINSASDELDNVIAEDVTYDSESNEFVVPAGAVNCFNLSISLSIRFNVGVSSVNNFTTDYKYLNSGSIKIVKDSESSDSSSSSVDFDGSAFFTMSTSTYLSNRSDYMFMKGTNETYGSSYWASFYNKYLVESWFCSFSYDDYDSNYNPIQIDSVLASSNYLVSKTSDTFSTYDIFADVIDGNSGLIYFNNSVLESNEMLPNYKSEAYSTALKAIATDNLTSYRCVVMANLGDVINNGDFNNAIDLASETTLGVSNLGKSASLNVLDPQNHTGHGNRFIADYSQYVLRNVAGRRIWSTAASAVVDLLNTNYNNGNEARPPFGPNYGRITAEGLSQELTGPQRKVVAQQYKINPILNDNGYFIWEELTSQLADTSLSDIHCILSFCWMKFMIYDAMKSFIAEYNDADTVNRALATLKDLNLYFISKKYIEEGKPDASNNVIGSQVLRLDYHIRFKGVARFIDVYVTAHSQTQELSISLGE